MERLGRVTVEDAAAFRAGGAVGEVGAEVVVEEAGDGLGDGGDGIAEAQAAAARARGWLGGTHAG